VLAVVNDDASLREGSVTGGIVRAGARFEHGLLAERAAAAAA
jgi:hypothetical protein